MSLSFRYLPAAVLRLPWFLRVYFLTAFSVRLRLLLTSSPKHWCQVSCLWLTLLPCLIHFLSPIFYIPFYAQSHNFQNCICFALWNLLLFLKCVFFHYVLPNRNMKFIFNSVFPLHRLLPTFLLPVHSPGPGSLINIFLQSFLASFFTSLFLITKVWASRTVKITLPLH